LINIVLYLLISFAILLLHLFSEVANAASEDLPKFTNVQSQAGIPHVGNLGQAATWGDYNSDGWLDLFVSNSDRSRRGPARQQNDTNKDSANYSNPIQRSYFFINEKGTFKDISEQIGIPNSRYKTATWADYNNDGFPDLLLGTKGAGMPPKLYKNLNGHSIKDISEKAGIIKRGSTLVHGIWADYDNDGSIDFYQAGKGKSFLYKNKGDGTFEDVTGEALINGKALSNSALWFDLNNDGYQDLFLVNYGFNNMYLNNKDGTFKDITEKSGLAGEKDWKTSSACSGDYNADGFFDIYVTNIGRAKRNALYKNNGDGTFSDITQETGTSDVGDGRTCAWIDFDADGRIDLFSTNHLQPNRLYKNLAEGGFEDVASQTGIDKPIDVFAATWGDYDRDGFLDVFLNGHLGTGLMKNTGNTNNSITLKLLGNGSSTNRSAIGARVELNTGKDQQFSEVSGGRGCCEQDMLPLYFGLGQNGKADILVKWPGGETCSFKDVSVQKVNHFIIQEAKCDIIPSEPISKN